MSIRFQQPSGQSGLTIVVSGTFGFDDHVEFRNALKACKPAIRVVVDLSKCEELESAALGMLALLDDQATSDGFEIRVIGCHGRPREIIELTPLQHMLTC